MMTDILKGKRPTDVFKEMLAENPTIENSDIADEFVDAFPRVRGEAMQAIWQWEKQGLRRGGVDDATIDQVLLEFLNEAGYL